MVKEKNEQCCWQTESILNRFIKKRLTGNFAFTFTLPIQVHFFYSKDIELQSATFFFFNYYCYYFCIFVFFVRVRDFFDILVCLYLPFQINTNYLGKLKYILAKMYEREFYFSGVLRLQEIIVMYSQVVRDF